MKERDRNCSLAGWLLIVGGIGVVLAATLWPFEFDFVRLTWREWAMSFKARPSSTLDAPLNILLFVPLGLGAAIVFRDSAAPRRRRVIWVAFLGFVISFCVETLQIFLPHRTPNLSDIATNTLGAVLGFVFVEAWQTKRRLFQRLFDRPARRYLEVALGSYLAINVIAWYALLRGMSPSGWNENYRLTIGSEFTTEQPWRGTIRGVLIMDRAVDAHGASELLKAIPPDSEEAIVALYPLVSTSDIGQQVQSVPAFEPIGETDFRVGKEGVMFGGRGGLTTKAALGRVAKRVNQSREFTLAVTVRPADLTQDGPARILTISSDPWHRNLNLGQSGENLTVEWRSLLTDEHGAMVEFHFPEIFRSTEGQTIVVTFDGLNLWVRTSMGVNSRVRLVPELGMAAILHDGRYWPLRVDGSGFAGSALLMAGIVYLPMGLLAGAWSSLMGTRFGRVAASVAGAILPPVLLEGILAFIGKSGVRIPMIALGLLTNLGAQMLIHTARQRWWVAGERSSCSA